MPVADMKGIVVHWTAGSHKATHFDRQHYHVLIEADGNVVRGIPSIDLNSRPRTKPGYAAHALNCNTGFIGVSLCCMGDFQSPSRVSEDPFVPGPYPMTREQWDVLPGVLATLCRRYGIPITPKTVLSHAEIQGTLGIAQRGKWDITRLAFDPSVKGAKACGDLFRGRAAALMDRSGEQPILTPPTSTMSVAEAQRRLFDAGYTMVGNIDGQVGLRTRTALRTMQEVNELPVTGEMDKATVAALRSNTLKHMPISEERAFATAATIRESSPIVRDAESGETVAKVAAIGSGAVGVGGFVAQVSDTATTVRGLLGDVPSWAWFLVLGGIAASTAGFMWWTARKIKDRRIAMHRAGETA